jgi:hypothetical protein
VVVGRSSAKLPAETQAAQPLRDVLERLRALADPDLLKSVARYGIPVDRAFGVLMPRLRALARELGVDHQPAVALWESGVHEARILDGLVDDPEELDAAQMERWRSTRRCSCAPAGVGRALGRRRCPAPAARPTRAGSSRALVDQLTRRASPPASTSKHCEFMCCQLDELDILRSSKPVVTIADNRRLRRQVDALLLPPPALLPVVDEEGSGLRC